MLLTAMDNNTEEQSIYSDTDSNLKKKLWLIRNCDWYNAEYSDCKRIRSRFHQYFIYGETLDCSQWKRDYANCCRWRETQDVDSADELIKSELKRRSNRLVPHYQNTVWENRTEPPENWDDPLPEWMQKQNENTFLAKKAEEIRNNSTGDLLSNRQSLCTIL